MNLDNLYPELKVLREQREHERALAQRDHYATVFAAVYTAVAAIDVATLTDAEEKAKEVARESVLDFERFTDTPVKSDDN
jgi:hypothetical protein